ncbi:uncharacterized protein DSM5745_01546 [Aspergillus mulundensis]|uniref:Uncharacterized protein n=1 Tax=Aspergillus mulundensis TaxID=1810919 RepID=A0A3D8T6T2_9EURO|nr:hypothetical protein DSM5745_01546 [Aspergillus mulundensis]RDW94224.1 hypothetical protein DSM5745_01546 [Aspergillus mulundensis]
MRALTRRQTNPLQWMSASQPPWEAIQNLLTSCQIIAVTQRAINVAMKKLLEDYPDICHVHCKSKLGNTLEAKINKAQVALKVTGASRENVNYTCTFSSGTLFFNYNKP